MPKISTILQETMTPSLPFWLQIQKAWLSGICMTCDFFLASEAKVLEASQAMMLNWLTTIPTTLSLPGLPNGLGPSLPNSVIGLRRI